MPPKKAAAKKAAATTTTTKKATPKKSAASTGKTPSKATSTKKTCSKLAGVTKKKTPAKTPRAVRKSPKPTHTRSTRTNDPDPPSPFGSKPYSPNTYVDGMLRRLGGEDWQRERAAELYRLHGREAIKKCGDDQTVLLNACLTLAWMEDSKSFGTSGMIKEGRCTDGTCESRYGMVDAKHAHEQVKWMSRMGAMEGVIARLMHPHQIAEQKHNFTDGTMRNPLTLPDGLKDDEDSSGRSGSSGNPVSRPLSGVKKSATKTKAAVKKTPLKSAGATKKRTPSKADNTAEKSVTKSKTGVKKTPSKPTGVTKKTPTKKKTPAKET
jgi:hypothetical protein